MADFDHWKKQYQATWSQSSQREMDIAAHISQQTGKKIIPAGLGAGSTAFLTGSSAQHGHTKGDADLHVEGTNIYLEVTGPLVRSVDENAALWIRPDKIQSARQYGAAHETWVVHHLSKTGLIRVVPLNSAFWTALDAGHFPVVTPRTQYGQERYHEIAPGHPCVKPIDVLIDRLNNI